MRREERVEEYDTILWPLSREKRGRKRCQVICSADQSQNGHQQLQRKTRRGEDWDVAHYPHVCTVWTWALKARSLSVHNSVMLISPPVPLLLTPWTQKISARRKTVRERKEWRAFHAEVYKLCINSLPCASMSSESEDAMNNPLLFHTPLKKQITQDTAVACCFYSGGGGWLTGTFQDVSVS